MTTATLEAPLDLKAAWQRWRFPAVIVALVIGVAIALAAIENAPPQRPLDPRDASPVGARALAALLEQRGVSVTTTSGIPVVLARTTTIFVPDPRSLTKLELGRLSTSRANLVVVAPGSRELVALGVNARPAGSITSERTIDPGCSLAAATTAGNIKFAGTTYATSDLSATSCYRAGAGAGVIAATHSGGDVVAVVGSARIWTNSRLGDNGDAALALRLLSTQPRVLWVLPRPPTQSPTDRQHKSLFDLLPARLLWALLQLVIVLVLVALWRGRRLGPVVDEGLPVIVPSAETVRGRARLLRAARARGSAAAELRTATVRRLSELLGLGPDAPPTAVVAAASERTALSPKELQDLLYGAEPEDDAALVTLAAALDDLEWTTKGRR